VSGLLDIGQDAFASEVIEASGSRLVLVDFWGPECGPCIKMMPWMEAFAAEVESQVKVVKVNAAENRKLAVRARVMGLPSVVLYRNGGEVARLSGDACTPSAIASLVRQHVPAS
jgi:thioredoxin 1